MTEVLTQHATLTGVPHATFAASLAEAFGVEFQLWVPGPTWQPLDDDQFPEHDAACALPPQVIELGRERGPQQAVDPCVVDQQDGSCLLAIPFLVYGQVQLVATATFPSQEADLVWRLGRQFVERHRLHQQLLEVATENEAFAQQVSENFEELVFLRSMAEQLDIAEIPLDDLGMSRAVLPLLNQSIKAESVMLVPAAPGELGTGVGYPVLRTGQTVLDDDECRKLIEHFGEAAQSRPLVCNHCRKSSEFSQWPQLDGFVLVQLSKREQTLGWLLAINRTGEASVRAVEPQWHLSDDEFGTGEASLLSTAASILATHATNVELLREKEKLLTEVVRSLVSAIEAKDSYTSGHSERVARFARRLGEALELDQDEIDRLYLSGLLHDVGKIGVRDGTLTKPSRLTDEEFAEIKKHPDAGWAILYDLEQLRYVLPGVLYHHERYDGHGYPDGLAGTQIPLDGRILAVCDAFDAMTSDRPYRQGMTLEKAAAILREGAGRQWDPQMVDAFLAAIDDIIQIQQDYRPPTAPQRVPGDWKAADA